MPKPSSIDFDVIIVGAGPAGTAAAYDLCQVGKSVLLLDRHTFPRHKPCAGGLTIKALQALRYPVDPVIRQRCRSLEIGKGYGPKYLFEGTGEICAMTVRSEFDAFCLDKAREAGARFRTTGRIHTIRETRAGIAIQADTGLLQTTHLIGADGANSRIRRLSGEFKEIASGFAIEGSLDCRPVNLPRMTFDFNIVPSGYGWLFPKNDHINIGLFTGSPLVTLKKGDLLDYALQKFGRTDVGNVSGHAMGMGGWRYRPRQAGVLLAGDAAGLVDPLLGEGLYNAIKSGQLAARAIAVSESAQTPASQIYDRLLKNIRCDLLYGYMTASWFYKMPNFGYWALTSRPARFALMQGFALGWPLGKIGTRFYRLPFLKC